MPNIIDNLSITNLTNKHYPNFLSTRIVKRKLYSSTLLVIIFLACYTALGCSHFFSRYIPISIVNHAYAADKVVDYFEFFQSVANQVKADYVEDISNKSLIEGALEGMLSSLDPHSMYLDEKSYSLMNNITQGEFGGIGVEIDLEKGLVRVITAYENGPAFKAGLKANDIIIMIDDQEISNIEGMSPIAEKLRGSPGSVVKLRILRNNNQMIDFTLIRELIKITPVKAKLIANNTIIYIKINNFNNKTANSVKSEFLNLVKSSANIDGLIIDLRWNPGGLLDQAVSVADIFLNGGDIVSIKGRTPELNTVYRSNNNDISNGMPIVVLINSATASAAEIVAGALQDNKRALVLGTKSFGKGSVQKLVPLTNGGAIKITTALYYTPLGTSIQAKGIVPNIIVNEAIVQPVVSYNAIHESSLKGHIPQVIDNQNKEDQLQNDSNQLGNSETNESIIDQEAVRTIAGDDIKDFQLLRAIDNIKTMALYNQNNINSINTTNTQIENATVE